MIYDLINNLQIWTVNEVKIRHDAILYLFVALFDEIARDLLDFEHLYVHIDLLMELVEDLSLKEDLTEFTIESAAHDSVDLLFISCIEVDVFIIL